MSFMLRKVGTELYIHSEIDPGGMGVWLMAKEHADRFDTKPVADSLKRRCNERYGKTNLEVVSCLKWLRAFSRRWRRQDEPLVDRRPYMEKCKRLRKDGPTPCFCCEGPCWGDQYERAMDVRGGGIRGS